MYIFRRFLSISIQCAVLSLWLQGLDSHQRSFGYEPNGLTASPPCGIGCWCPNRQQGASLWQERGGLCQPQSPHDAT